MTDKELANHLRALDNSSMCPGCRQPLFLEDCTPEKCNSRGESPYCDNRDDDEPGHNQFGEVGYWAGAAQ